jgi:hypothetical protein
MGVQSISVELIIFGQVPLVTVEKSNNSTLTYVEFNTIKS